MTSALRALAITVGVALIAATPAAAMSASESKAGTVVRVVDGDTVIVQLGWFSEERVRPLNIDAPESVKPNTPVACLGLEASNALKSLLPKGTTVRVETDAVARDEYKRQLAGVFVGSTLVNAEMAKRGLAVPVKGGKNKKFLPPVQKAFEEAQASGVGFFEPGAVCGVPAEAQAAAQSAGAIKDPASASEDELQAIAGESASVGLLVAALAAKNDHTSSHVRAAQAAMVRGLQQHLAGIDTKVTERRSAIEQEKAAVAKAAEEERQAQAAEEQRQAEAAEVKASGGGSPQEGCHATCSVAARPKGTSGLGGTSCARRAC